MPQFKKDPLKRFGLIDNRVGAPSKKMLARRWTFEMYREISGNWHLPRTLQYWTLAGPIVLDSDPRRLQPMCEVVQAVRERLIDPDQYRGIDHNPEFHAANIQQRDLPLTLEYGEIDDVMFTYLDRGELCPGVINLDSTHGPQRAVSLLARVNRVLRHMDERPLVIFLNLQMGNIWNRIASDRDREVVAAIQSSLEVSGMLLREGWKLHPATWSYGGTGAGARSSMRSYCFARGFRIRARSVA